MSTFWGSDYHVLFQKQNVFEIIPIPQMPYTEKLNALSRLIILLSLIGFLLSFSFRYLIAGIISLACIYVFQKVNKEGFSLMPQADTIMEMTKNYYPTKENNPLGNVLLTDYIDNPQRKSASPSFNPEVVDVINSKSKEITKDLNVGLNIKPLYSGLGNNIEFEDLMQQFYTTPATTIPNDQGAFSNFLYGNMPSCKEGDVVQCVKDNYRYTTP